LKQRYNSALQAVEAEIQAESANHDLGKRAEMSSRTRRNEEMEGGRSLPPKLKEENLFSEEDSRRPDKPIYQTKEEKNN
jgi:hypothetical protein